MRTVKDFREAKGKRLVYLTAYDYPTARLCEAAGVDAILVGDSLGMVVLGYPSTVPVTLEEMLHHTKAARRGAPGTFLVADLPYLGYATLDRALLVAERLIKEGGADAVKLEGGEEVALPGGGAARPGGPEPVRGRGQGGGLPGRGAQLLKEPGKGAGWPLK